MRLSRPALTVLASLVAALGVPAVAGAAGAASATGRTERVLLTLTPHDPAALHALARGRGRSGHSAARTTALRAALPSPADRASVVDAVRSLGLSVDRVGTMAVLVHGPAALVDGLFGSARAVDPHSRVQHPLPTLPAVLGGRVEVALGGDDTRPAFRHYTDPPATGTDLRTAYGDTVTDPLHGGAATQAERAETIATVQLSGWHSSDLTAYAGWLRQETGRSWPAPRYTGVDDPLLPSCLRTPTNGKTCSTNTLGDDVEVALDQEAIYSVAPYARQRAYLSGNDLLGMYDSLESIGDDATDPTIDRHIVAANISWGFCETDIAGDPSAQQMYGAFEDALSYVLASGVTVFSASGDNGPTCDGSHPGVSYPASSPQVVSVGGTASPDGSSPSDPTTQTAWDDSTGASGGGVSRVFGQPAYQSGVSSAAARCPVQQVAASCRTVPDIAALAGNPGFEVISNGPTGGGIVGGTSLASPLATATFAAQVAQHGYSWGVGDILPGLYAQQSAFTDIPPAGYDETTGLGSPDWSALVSTALGGDPHLSVLTAYSPTTTIPVAVRVPDWQSYDSYRIDVDPPGDQTGGVCQLDRRDTPTPPTSVAVDDFGSRAGADGIHMLTLVAIKAPASASGSYTCHYSSGFVFVDTTNPTPRPSLAVRGGRRDLLASWSGGDSGGSGIASYAVVLRQVLPHSTRVVWSTTTAQAGSHALHARRNAYYSLSVTTTDRAGNVATRAATAIDDRQFELSSGWHRQSAAAAFDDGQSLAQHHAARARVVVIGRVFRLYVETCPQCGKLGVYVFGHLRTTVDTYSRHRHHRVGFTVYSIHNNRAKPLVIRPLHRRNSHSSGYQVMVDAVASKG